MKSHPERKYLRLRGYDYSSEGAYFVTICTKNMVHYFGEIRSGIMGLNEMGIVAHEYFQNIPNHFEYAILDEFVIMPNHIHGIIFIDWPNPIVVGDADLRPLRWDDRTKMGLSKIIHGFKSSVTRTINDKDFDADVLFAWQRSYNDHIIRNENALNQIRQYIRYNPRKWDEDENNMKK